MNIYLQSKFLCSFLLILEDKSVNFAVLKKNIFISTAKICKKFVTTFPIVSVTKIEFFVNKSLKIHQYYKNSQHYLLD